MTTFKQIIRALKRLAGKHVHTLTLDKRALATRVLFSGWLFIIPGAWRPVHYFGGVALGKLPWLYLLTGIDGLVALASHKDCANCAWNENVSMKNVWIDLRSSQIAAAPLLVLT